MQTKLAQLKQRLNEISDLSGVIALLGWDQQTYMPERGSEGRGNLLETTSRILHQKTTSDELAGLLEDLMPYALKLDPESDDACLILKAHRSMEKEKKVPIEWVTEFARLTSVAQSAWEKARAQASFAIFEPDLNRIVEMRQAYSEFFAPYTIITLFLDS